jgi:hypothetical protein
MQHQKKQEIAENSIQMFINLEKMWRTLFIKVCSLVAKNFLNTFFSRQTIFSGVCFELFTEFLLCWQQCGIFVVTEQKELHEFN